MCSFPGALPGPDFYEFRERSFPSEDFEAHLGPFRTPSEPKKSCSRLGGSVIFTFPPYSISDPFWVYLEAFLGPSWGLFLVEISYKDLLRGVITPPALLFSGSRTPSDNIFWARGALSEGSGVNFLGEKSVYISPPPPGPPRRLPGGQFGGIPGVHLEVFSMPFRAIPKVRVVIRNCMFYGKGFFCSSPEDPKLEPQFKQNTVQVLCHFLSHYSVC